MCDRINEHYPARQKKVNWQWRSPFSTKHSKVEEEMSEEKFFEQLDKKLSEIFAFEEKLTKLLQQEV